MAYTQRQLVVVVVVDVDVEVVQVVLIVEPHEHFTVGSVLVPKGRTSTSIIVLIL
jgi:hypothetical protein